MRYACLGSAGSDHPAGLSRSTLGRASSNSIVPGKFSIDALWGFNDCVCLLD